VTLLSLRQRCRVGCCNLVGLFCADRLDLLDKPSFADGLELADAIDGFLRKPDALRRFGGGRCRLALDVDDGLGRLLGLDRSQIA
jgi:hypothetical protein